MSNRLLIGFAVFLAIFLGLPIASQYLRGTPQTTAANAATAPSSAAPAVVKQPPLINEQNIVGSTWKIDHMGTVLKITVQAGGVCYLEHPLMKSATGQDFIEGRWALNYDKGWLETQVGGQRFYVELEIRGNELWDPKVNRRIERY